jgi:hypothetical protein
MGASTIISELSGSLGFGATATALLRRQPHHRGVKFAVSAGGGIGGAALVWSVGGRVGVFFGVLWWACAVAIVVRARWQLSAVAVELSRFYGTRIRSGELPIMSPARFDRWASKRGLRGSV